MTRGKTMMSKIPAYAPIYSSVLIARALILGAGGSAYAKFNLSNVGPDYGCRLSTETVVEQLIQLHTNRKGAVESGTMRFNEEGEVCNFTLASGSYDIHKTSGTGTITLTWTFSSGSDGDEGFCTADFPGGSFTEHFLFVLERSGAQLDLVTSDPGLTGAAFTGSDSGDFPKFGSCTKQ
jgi:hypothetical protein